MVGAVQAVRVSAEEEAREELFDAMLADPSCSPRVLVYFHGTTATRSVSQSVRRRGQEQTDRQTDSPWTQSQTDFGEVHASIPISVSCRSS